MINFLSQLLFFAQNVMYTQKKLGEKIKNKWPRCKKCKQQMVVKIYGSNTSTST